MTDVPGTIVDLDNAPATPPEHSREFAWDRAIRLYDPEFDQSRRTEIEYEFNGRTFTARPADRWPFTYDDTPPPVIPPAQNVGIAWIPPESAVFTLTSVLPEGTQFVRPDLLVNTPTFPLPTVIREAPPLSVQLNHLANTSTFHAATFAPGAVTVQLDHLENNANEDLDPTVIPGAISVQLGTIASAASVPALQNVGIAFPEQTIALGTIAAGSSVLAPTITVGGVTVTLNAIATGANVFAPVVAPAAVSVALGTIASGATVHAPTIAVGARATPLALLSNTSVIHAPTITVGNRNTPLDHLLNTSVIHSPTVSVAASGISFVGSAGGINSVTMPAHQVGDLIVAFAYRDGNTTAPSLPVGWSSPDAVGGGATNSGNTQSARIGYKFAASTSETSGTWTNATGLVIHVYRGVSNRSPFQFIKWVNAASSLAMTYGPLDAIVRQDTSTWVVAFAGHRSQNAAVNTAPTGLTNRTDYSDATNHVAGHDTAGGTNSASTYSNTVSGTANGYITAVIDLTEEYAASGSNICTNGTFDTNTTGWTLDAAWSRQTDQASPCLGSTGAGQYATWPTGLTLGTVYEVSYTSFVDIGQINIVTSNFGGMNNPSPTATGRTIRRLIRLTGGTANIQFQGGTGYRIDNVEIQTIS